VDFRQRFADACRRPPVTPCVAVAQLRNGIAGHGVVADPAGDRGMVVAQAVCLPDVIDRLGKPGVGNAGLVDQRGEKQVRLGHTSTLEPEHLPDKRLRRFTPGVTTAPRLSAFTPCRP
jgi:hypothetical protein